VLVVQFSYCSAVYISYYGIDGKGKVNGNSLILLNTSDILIKLIFVLCIYVLVMHVNIKRKLKTEISIQCF
jgi:hypothetical protein